jgi:phosphatidate cytidylyltransferase
LIFLFRFNDIRMVAAEVGMLAFGILYVPLLLGYLPLVRTGGYGIKWIFLMMFIVMSGDSAAYYLGCRFGKHKLYAAVSPNKSIEGAIGGILGSLAGAFIAKAVFFPQISVPLCILTAVVVGMAGQLGDLFESLLKRSCGVKDSGNIIPGHGGVLDRLDSILFAAPVIWFMSTLL